MDTHKKFSGAGFLGRALRAAHVVGAHRESLGVQVVPYFFETVDRGLIDGIEHAVAVPGGV